MMQAFDSHAYRLRPGGRRGDVELVSELVSVQFSSKNELTPISRRSDFGPINKDEIRAVNLVLELGRVDLGGRPPRPPTDPDVRVKRIWLFIS